LAEEIDQVAWQNNPGKRMTVTVPASWLTKIRGQVASLASPPSEPPADLAATAQRIKQVADALEGQSDELLYPLYDAVRDLERYRPEPADGKQTETPLEYWRSRATKLQGELEAALKDGRTSRSDAVGEVEKSLREMSVWFEERRREKVAYGDSEIMSLSLHRLSKKTLKLADKLAGSEVGERYPCEECDQSNGCEHMAEPGQGLCKRLDAWSNATPEPHPDAESIANEMELAVVRLPPVQYEQLFDKVIEWKDALRRLQPHHADPSPSVAAVIEDMEQPCFNVPDHESVYVTASRFRRWISQLRAATAGPGEVCVITVNNPPLEIYGMRVIANEAAAIKEVNRLRHGLGLSVDWCTLPVHGAPQPEKDGAECSECVTVDAMLDSAGAPRMAKKDPRIRWLMNKTERVEAERDKLQADLDAECEECNRWREVLIACYGALGETGAFVSIPDHIKRIMADLAAEREAHEETRGHWREMMDASNANVQRTREAKERLATERARADKAEQAQEAQEGHMVEAGRLRAQMEELETQLDSTRHRASEAEARAAHEIRLAKHQGEQRIKAEKRVGELEKQLEAVGDAAVRSLVQLAEKHSQNEPCAVSCEYFHCDSLLPRCGKTGKTFPTIDNCPSPPNQCEECDRHQLTIDGPGPCTDRHNCAALRGKPPRPSTESGECPCDGCECWRDAWERMEECREYSSEGTGDCPELDAYRASQTPCRECGKLPNTGDGDGVWCCETDMGSFVLYTPTEWIDNNEEKKTDDRKSAGQIPDGVPGREPVRGNGDGGNHRVDAEVRETMDANRIGKIGVTGPSTKQIDSAAQSGRANREGMELVGERIREAEKG
jgi:hypothetical protein